MAGLRLLAGPAWPPAQPALIALSFVPHFRALSSRAGCQTPSRTPSPACYYGLGRWRWPPGAAPEPQWEEPREGEELSQGGRARTQPHRNPRGLSPQPGCS